MEELEYKPLTRAELEVVDLKNYFAFSTIATEQFGRTVSERVTANALAERNARVFALNQRHRQTWRQAEKTLEDMRRAILMEYFERHEDGFDCPPGDAWSNPSMMQNAISSARRTK